MLIDDRFDGHGSAPVGLVTPHRPRGSAGRRRWTMLLVLAGVGGAACSDQGPDDELESNRRRWEASRPESYVYALERLCFCGAEARGPVRVTVSLGTVAGRTYVQNGGAVAAPFAELFPSVNGLFEVLEEAIERDAHEVRVTYDPTTGVPTEVWIDYARNVRDEELGFQVTEPVQPIPSPLSYSSSSAR